MREYSGIAKKGKGRAGELGYPTANLSVSGGLPAGIYAAEVELRGKKYASAVFSDPERKLLEAHLLDFSGDLQGDILTIRIIKKIRESRRFKNDADLRAQIEKDVGRVRETHHK